MQKQNYVKVTYDMRKGLRFKWNFKDLYQYYTFYHHVFVLEESDHERLHNFINAYYKKLKCGDLFTFIYYDEDRQTARKTKWIEKTQLSSFQSKDILKYAPSRQLSNQKRKELAHITMELTRSSTEHYIVNFLLDSKSNQKIQHLRLLIEEGRKQGGFSYICTFFGPFNKNFMTITTGINFFSIKNQDLTELLNFYHISINKSAIKMAEVTLECSNGQLLSYDSKEWKNVEFNRIERKFYGPSATYDEDDINFHLLDQFTYQEFNLEINLRITLFSGIIFRNTKKIKLSFPPDKYEHKSINLPSGESEVNILGIWIASNPDSSSIWAKIIKSVDQSQ